jgi:hypothetical protein
VIFSSGHGNRAELEDVLSRPNVRYLLKPYDAETLMRTVAEVTNSSDS